MFKMAIVLIIVSAVQCEVLVKINDTCSCENLLLESECELVEKCTFQNSKCTTLDCKDLKTHSGCKENKKCAWYQEKCQDFTKCESYTASIKTECEDLFHGCGFSKEKSTCIVPSSLTTTCSSQFAELCLAGKEGLCIPKSGKCEEWKTCEDGNGIDFRCLLAWPACSWDPITTKCNSARTCKEALPNMCTFAKKEINGDDLYLCNQKDCSDFDPATQTQDNCFINSLRYYHWKNGACEKCTDSTNISYILISSIILSLII